MQTGELVIVDDFEKGFIYYEEEDESGNIVYKSPEFTEDGKFYLEEGKLYYWTTTIQSGDSENTQELRVNLVSNDEWVEDFTNDGIGNNNDNDDASFIERAITWFLMLIGTGFYLVMCLVIGEAFSIESVIFNKYTNTRLAFFTNDVTSAATDNQFMSESGIRDVLSDFFEVFTGIAIVVYLIILVYMGIRIMLGATAERGSRYKELILYWLEGVLILFLFPYVMKYSININNAFVSFLYENKNAYISIMDNQPVAQPVDGDFSSFTEYVKVVYDTLSSGTDYMSIMYQSAWTGGWLVFAICWFVMFFQMIGFLIVYFKRVLVTMFLIAIFPLVMISYAIDKIGDAKSQAFDNWIKEFMLNVFVQSFHAITYVLIMSILSMLMTDPTENWLLMLIALTFVSKGDDILRGIFSLTGSAKSVKGVGSTFAKTLAVTKAAKSIRGIGSAITNPKGLGMKVYNRAAQLNQKAWDNANDRVTRTSAKIKRDALEDVPTNPLNGVPLPLTASKKETEADIRDAVNILLGKKEGGASNDEIRNSADKLTGYLNQTENADVQEILDNIANELTPEERQKLDNLIMQNVHINALMRGGREINVRQNINIILSLLQKDANGNFTPESYAILNKIAYSEDELKAMKLFGGIKFNKKNVIEVRDGKSNPNRVGNNPYFREREVQNIKRTFKGRGRAKENKATNKDAKSELEVIMKTTGSTLTNYSAKNTNASRKAKRTVRRTAKPGQERAGSKIQQNARKTREEMNGTTKRKSSKFKPLRQPKKPWQNVDSVTGSAGLETAKNVAGNTASTATGYSAKTKFKISPKNQNPAIQTSRAEKIKDPVDRIVKYTPSKPVGDEEKKSSTTTDYGRKVPERKNLNVKPDTERVTVREMKKKKEDARKFAMEQKQEGREKSHSFKPGSGTFAIKRNVENQRRANQEKKDETINMPGSNQMSTRASSGGTMHNAGAGIASRQGSEQDILERINESKPSKAKIKFLTYSDRDIENGKNLFNYFAHGDVKGYKQDRNKKLSNHLAFDTPKGYAPDDVRISKDTQKELENLGSAISVLTQADGGYYTAKELLDNVKFVQQVAEKYEDATGDEKFVLDKMINFLDCRPEDYEAYLRVKILNDPDSVGNDRKIIEECKDYVKNTPMLSVIKDKLGYNMEDLKEGQNLKFVNSRKTDYDGIVSEEQRARVKEKYEKELERYELDREIARLDKKIDENYSVKSYAKDAGGLAVDTFKFLADMYASVGGGIATGLMGAGMSTDGKEETLSQAAENFVTTYSATNDAYGAAKKNISGVYKGAKDYVTSTFPIEEEENNRQNNPIQEFTRPKDYNARVNELRDKTTVKSPLFGNRGNNKK